MQARKRGRLFTILAPVTVPAYVLFLAASNLLGGAFYIVIEATVARLLRRPVSMSRGLMAVLALPVLAAAPFAMAVHLVLWFVRLIGRLLLHLGRWQVDSNRAAASLITGLVWAAAAVWTTVTCFNAGVGLGWIAAPLAGRDAYVEFVTRYRTLGDMPPAMQARRQAIIREVETGKASYDLHWEHLLSALQDDDASFGWLDRQRPLITKRLTGLAWFFIPKELSTDGLDHSQLFLGPMLLVVMLLVRWPGMFRVVGRGLLRWLLFGVRTVGAVGAVYWLATWTPKTSYAYFWFGGDAASDVPSTVFVLLSPAAWFGASVDAFVRPEWYLLNAGLWLLLVALAVFLWWLAWRISPLLGWPRYYVAFLAARLLQRKRIAFFSVGAVTLCVAMMIIVISVMGGFVDHIRNRAHGLLGDLVMDGGLQGFPYYEAFIARLGALKDEQTGERMVVQATPLIHTYGILQFPQSKRTKAVSVWGIRLDEYVRVNEFGKDLFYENRFGGTDLGLVRKPVYGFDEYRVARLPGEMDDRYRRYLETLPPSQQTEERKRYDRQSGELYPGPGVFDMATSTGLEFGADDSVSPTTRTAPSAGADGVPGPDSGADADAESESGLGTGIRPGYEGKPYPGIIIGRDIIAQRMPSGEYRRLESYPRGEHCFLTVLPLTRGGDVSSEPPPKPSFRYIDDSRTGIHEIDSQNVYVGYDYLQRLLSMEAQTRVDGTQASPRCSQIQIKLTTPYRADRRRLREAKAQVWQLWEAFRSEVRDQADAAESMMLGQVDVQTWEEMQQGFISAIEKEKFLVLIMFGVISIVAVFLILCIFYMIVQEKTRDIGIIKSVGGSAEGVAAVFLAYGGAIGLVGCVLGALLGITFVENINEVQDWLARLNPDWRVWSPETYSFDQIPDTWKWGEVVWISILAVVSSIVGATFPALRASRLWPVETLRYE